MTAGDERTAPDRRGRMIVWLYGFSLLMILAFGLAPVASVAIAGFIADTNNCVLNEGNVHPCIVAGTDVGRLLYTMGVLGWLMLVTIPIGGLLLIGWVIVLAIHIVVRVFKLRPAGGLGRKDSARPG